MYSSGARGAENLSAKRNSRMFAFQDLHVHVSALLCKERSDQRIPEEEGHDVTS